MSPARIPDGVFDGPALARRWPKFWARIVTAQDDFMPQQLTEHLPAEEAPIMPEIPDLATAIAELPDDRLNVMMMAANDQAQRYADKGDPKTADFWSALYVLLFSEQDRRRDVLDDLDPDNAPEEVGELVGDATGMTEAQAWEAAERAASAP